MESPELAGYPPSVEHYRNLRSCGKNFTTLILDVGFKLEFSVLDAARKLMIPVKGKRIVFDSEAEMDTLMDFALHDFRPRGRRMVDCPELDKLDLTEQQRQLLQAHREARASLFEITGCIEGLCEVQLKDLLHPEQAECSIIDIHLSMCVSRMKKTLLFAVFSIARVCR